jgi:mersacidin/lichenicidin family type 2 lantibiotic
MANSNFDIARAMKDQAYFNSLSDEQKAVVRAANPVGEAGLGDQDLDSVSGGLEGGDLAASTTTTTDLKQCTCGSTASMSRSVAADCTCAC